MAAVNEFLVGQPARAEQLPQYTDWQQQLFKGLGESGLRQLQNPYEGFQPIQQNAQKFYQEQLLPSIAERFNQTGGSITSPSFHSQSHQGAQSLSENLAAMQSQYGMQNRSQGLSMLGLGLTPQFQNYPMAAQQGLVQSPGFWKLLASLIGGGIGGLTTGGIGFVPGALGTYGALSGFEGGYNMLTGGGK